MKTNPRFGRAAFTLIELMAVITIIVILAGLVVGGMSFVNDRQAKEKAKVQIALISKALEDYKLDNGTYPPTDNTPTGVGKSSTIFKALYFDSDADDQGAPGDTDQKVYLAELNPATSKQGWTSGTATANNSILDPWGAAYNYRTALNSTGTANAATQNPDYDLWSMGKDGRSNAGVPADRVNFDDVKNF